MEMKISTNRRGNEKHNYGSKENVTIRPEEWNIERGNAVQIMTCGGQTDGIQKKKTRSEEGCNVGH